MEMLYRAWHCFKENSQVKLKNPMERRAKIRFAVTRELRYKLLEHDKIIATGHGETIDIGSGGIAFRTDTLHTAGDYIELSISWPALLDDTCPMRLVVYGRVVRRSASMVASTVEKWEFRTGSRRVTPAIPMQTDNRLMRWVEYRKDVMMKASGASALA
jgi:hypothetical protein